MKVSCCFFEWSRKGLKLFFCLLNWWSLIEYEPNLHYLLYGGISLGVYSQAVKITFSFRMLKLFMVFCWTVVGVWWRKDERCWRSWCQRKQEGRMRLSGQTDIKETMTLQLGYVSQWINSHLRRRYCWLSNKVCCIWFLRLTINSTGLLCYTLNWYY